MYRFSQPLAKMTSALLASSSWCLHAITLAWIRTLDVCFSGCLLFGVSRGPLPLVHSPLSCSGCGQATPDPSRTGRCYRHSVQRATAPGWIEGGAESGGCISTASGRAQLPTTYWSTRRGLDRSHEFHRRRLEQRDCEFPRSRMFLACLQLVSQGWGITAGARRADLDPGPLRHRFPSSPESRVCGAARPTRRGEKNGQGPGPRGLFCKHFAEKRTTRLSEALVPGIFARL